MKRRTSYLQYDQRIELGKRGFRVWAYGKDRRFACRLEVNSAGVALYSGTKGKKRIANLSWEQLVERLTRKP